jgi:hypothetical protein
MITTRAQAMPIIVQHQLAMTPALAGMYTR